MRPTHDKLHLGCGNVVPDTWLNVDGSWSARIAKYPILHKTILRLAGRTSGFKSTGTIYGHNLRKPLPWDAGSFTAVYASHLLEHMYLDDADRLLKECYRVLKPGGVCRMVVPDLEPLIRGYLGEGFPSWLDRYEKYDTDADRLCRGLLMRDPTPPTGNIVIRIYDALSDFHSHKWMYNGRSLSNRLAKAGFVDVQVKGAHESRIPTIDHVELRERVVDGAGVAVEGVKPG